LATRFAESRQELKQENRRLRAEVARLRVENADLHERVRTFDATRRWKRAFSHE